MNALTRIFSNLRQTNVEPVVLRFLVQRPSGRKAGIIEVRNDQSFTDLDLAIRRLLGYSGWDHCSALFEGLPWESPCIVELYPDNSAPGQLKQISTLPLEPGVQLGYVYDFGKDRQLFVTLEDILPIDSQKDYPLITKGQVTGKTRRIKRTGNG